MSSIQAIAAEGFAGVNKEGRIVDRREEKDAQPIPKNSLLGIPKPKRR
jgi:hypothetical protein